MELVQRLSILLQQPLPGEAAHSKLAPYRKNFTPKGVEPKHSAVMALFYLKDEKWHLALTKRNEYSGTHSAQVSFPGGKKDEIDSDLIFTAIRETKEEIGVQIEKNQIIGLISSVYIPPSNFLVQPVLAWSPVLPQFELNTREVNYIIEISIDQLKDPASLSHEKIKMSTGLTMTVPCFKIENEIIWGATAVILSEIKELFEKIE